MPETEDGAVGLTLLKYVILLATLPVWGPFAQALWEEFVHAMRVEGGLWGPEPGPKERQELEEKIASEEPRQVHELLAHQRKRMQAGESSAPPEALGSPTGDPGIRGGEQRGEEAPDPRGFRR